jgi:hypothetical protein
MQGHIGVAHGPRMVNHQAGRFAQQLYSMYYNQGKSLVCYEKSSC